MLLRKAGAWNVRHRRHEIRVFLRLGLEIYEGRWCSQKLLSDQLARRLLIMAMVAMIRNDSNVKAQERCGKVVSGRCVEKIEVKK